MNSLCYKGAHINTPHLFGLTRIGIRSPFQTPGLFDLFSSPYYLDFVGSWCAISAHPLGLSKVLPLLRFYLSVPSQPKYPFLSQQNSIYLIWYLLTLSEFTLEQLPKYSFLLSKIAYWIPTFWTVIINK